MQNPEDPTLLSDQQPVGEIRLSDPFPKVFTVVYEATDIAHDEGAVESTISADDIEAITHDLNNYTFDEPENAEPASETPVRASNFLLTAMINQIAGNPTNGGWLALDRQIKIIESEFQELKDAIAARDIHETRDGIQDLLFTAYGGAHLAGFEGDDDFLEVVKSNMSKFDDSEEDCLLTQEKYSALGIKTNGYFVLDPTDGHKYYVTKSAIDQNDAKGKYIPAGKWLKSYKFVEPQYDELPVEVLVMLRGPEGSLSHSTIKAVQDKIEQVEQQLTAQGYPGVYVTLAYDAPGSVWEITQGIIAALQKIEVTPRDDAPDAEYYIKATMIGSGEVALEPIESELPDESAAAPEVAVSVSGSLEDTHRMMVVQALLVDKGFDNVTITVEPGNTASADQLAEIVDQAIRDAVSMEDCELTIDHVTVHIKADTDMNLRVVGTDPVTGDTITLGAQALDMGASTMLVDLPAANDDSV